MSVFRFDRKQFVASLTPPVQVIPAKDMLTKVGDAIQQEFILSHVPIPIQPDRAKEVETTNEILMKTGEKLDMKRYERNLEDIMADPNAEDVIYLRQQLVELEQDLAKKKIEITNQLVKLLTNDAALQKIINPAVKKSAGTSTSDIIEEDDGSVRGSSQGRTPSMTSAERIEFLDEGGSIISEYWRAGDDDDSVGESSGLTEGVETKQTAERQAAEDKKRGLGMQPTAGILDASLIRDMLQLGREANPPPVMPRPIGSTSSAGSPPPEVVEFEVRPPIERLSPAGDDEIEAVIREASYDPSDVATPKLDAVAYIHAMIAEQEGVSYEKRGLKDKDTKGLRARLRKRFNVKGDAFLAGVDQGLVRRRQTRYELTAVIPKAYNKPELKRIYNTGIKLVAAVDAAMNSGEIEKMPVNVIERLNYMYMDVPGSVASTAPPVAAATSTSTQFD